MPSGQSHTTWFPELKTMLKDLWGKEKSIPEQFELVNKLNEKLVEIRIAYKVKPPMIWCSKCKEKHEGRLPKVTITSMYYSLRRFDICSDTEFKALMKAWKAYSRENNIDINGNLKEENTRAQQ